jgi:hypothetical protein
MARPLMKISNSINMVRFVKKYGKTAVHNDFFVFRRDYNNRYRLYDFVMGNLKDTEIDYLEFGVADAASFKYWLDNYKNKQSRFYGFDTFEGIPENWGKFKKGEMAASIPSVSDDRAHFIKGLFQDTLPDFLISGKLVPGRRKIIHIDCDLFSATLYVLTNLNSYLKQGDILLFDEFNVPDHEFSAFNMYLESYYKSVKMIGATNNYLQVAFEMI